jgi:hypothetical protein
MLMCAVGQQSTNRIMHADFPGVVLIQPDKALITSASIIKMHPALISIESWYETLNHTHLAAVPAAARPARVNYHF